jgi:hypothetical protein
LNPGLQSFLADNALLVDLAVSETEINFLASIHIYGNIPLDKEFYVKALIQHRRDRAAKKKEG